MKITQKPPSTRFSPLPDDRKFAQVITDSPSKANDNTMNELDRRLDEALKETFPASDPVAVMICRKS